MLAVTYGGNFVRFEEKSGTRFRRTAESICIETGIGIQGNRIEAEHVRRTRD